MEVKTILDTYKRYLRTLNCSDAELFTNYKKMKDFINEHCKGDDFGAALEWNFIGRNLEEIRKRGIRIKDYSNGAWDALAAKKGCMLIERIKKLDLFFEKDAYKVNSWNFWKLAEKQSPYTQLFLYKCFAERLGMSRLFEVSMEEIEKAAAMAIKAEEEGAIASEAEVDTQSETAK